MIFLAIFLADPDGAGSLRDPVPGPPPRIESRLAAAPPAALPAAPRLWRAALPDPDPEAAAGLPVAGPAALAAALEAARGGEVFLLAPGEYGPLALDRVFARPVTLRAATPGTARFTRVGLTGAGGIRLEGLVITGGLRAEAGTRGLALTGSTVAPGIYLREVAEILIAQSRIGGGRHALILNHVTGAAILGNTIHDAAEDLMRVTGRSRAIRIENNTFRDTHGERPMHPDCLQLFAVDGVTPRDIVIRGNHFHDDPATGTVQAQGIFLSDPGPEGYRDILIEENLINVRSPNSIYVNGGQENVIVRNNTLIPAAGDSGAVIRLAAKSGLDNSGVTVVGNVAKELADETGASGIGANHWYGRGADLARLFRGRGAEWQDFLPVPGSPVDFGRGFGALGRLADLLAGR